MYICLKYDYKLQSEYEDNLGSSAEKINKTCLCSSTCNIYELCVCDTMIYYVCVCVR